MKISDKTKQIIDEAKRKIASSLDTNTLPEPPEPIYVVDPEDFQINSRLNLKGYTQRLALSRSFDELNPAWFKHFTDKMQVLMYSADEAKAKDRDGNHLLFGHFMLENEETTIIIYQSSQKVVYFHSWAHTLDICTKYCNEFKQFFSDKEENVLDELTLKRTVTFWAQSSEGYTNYSRKVELFDWEKTKINYSPKVCSSAEELLNLTAPVEGGRVIIFYGPPGTGKTSFIRALARKWSNWCHTSYILDPEKFFYNPAAMLEVITWDYSRYLENGLDSTEGYHLLIIEDAEEMIKADAQKTQGQNMSRLLNLADGLLGQSTNLLILITTNAELNELHSALSRPGRTLAKIHFDSFEADEAIDWINTIHPEIEDPKAILKKIASSRDSISNKYTLAELFEAVSVESKQISHAPALVQVPGQYL